MSRRHTMWRITRKDGGYYRVWVKYRFFPVWLYVDYFFSLESAEQRIPKPKPEREQEKRRRRENKIVKQYIMK